jgi:hypothetical protein
MAENNIYSSEVCPEESLLHSRPEGEGNDQQLVRVPHVPEHNELSLESVFKGTVARNDFWLDQTHPVEKGRIYNFFMLDHY